MIDLADQGDTHREDNGCGILYGILRDSAYKLKKLAEEEKQNLMNRYNEYYDEVMEYFKNRKKDFLVFDVIGSDNWDKLCNFLGKPIPDVPFPRKRVAKYKTKNQGLY